MRTLTVLICLLLSMVLLVPTGVASAAPPVPRGSLQSVHVNSFSNNVVINGSAIDPSAPSKATSVLVTIDGSGFGGWRAASVGGHGFAIAITVPTGRHVVCVAARRANGTAPTTGLGCFAFQAYPQATKADMVAIARTIDPKNTISWSLIPLSAGTSGQALPWDRKIDIASGNSVRYLRAVMLHEWSHVLQYRAFAGVDPWWDAVQAFNALSGSPDDRSSYSGVEHGADCIALALGADYQGYGCPAALKTYGARIAAGVLMNARQGSLESVKATGGRITVAGWTLDPSHPTTAASFQVYDNGNAITAAATTTVSRADVNSTTGVSGVHGFSVTVPIPAGAHRICVTALTVCRNITT